mgnify:CR=1 FL=1
MILIHKNTMQKLIKMGKNVDGFEVAKQMPSKQKPDKSKHYLTLKGR